MVVGENACEHVRSCHYGNDDKLLQEQFSRAFKLPS